MLKTIDSSTVPLRVCKDCGLAGFSLEFLESFEKGKTCKYGRKNLCKECSKKRGKKYREANPEKVKECWRIYHKANREKIMAKNKRYREANPEKIKEARRKYNEAHREEKNEANRKYTKNNLEKIRIKTQKWRKANPFKYALSTIKNRSNKKGVSFDLTEEYLFRLWNDCAGICPMTGVPMLKTSNGNNPFMMSIDRLDPEKGYIKGNIRLVNLWYNMTRRNWGDHFTFDMCQRVIARVKTGDRAMRQSGSQSPISTHTRFRGRRIS